MAKIIKNDKGFKVISCSMSETTKFCGMGICDCCSKAAFNGYIVCVLVRWYCEECYQEWNKEATYYPEDVNYELSMFNQFKKVLNITEVDNG
ncbi:hypothetical protein ORI89_19115 [Sphingobacterium sp. UT-1RO-CII-1]|uniref:hypothetical protein n=1 Tax=Sphingobacterium sp. UT-1RO-CII-1 TaxID=2995225 RepID=UPI00227A3E4D|nr:hypothetical protein [Sphingobacterium sp. UT-1RO-CII-1]MCY4781765.1 hypothetical protein [Sphingobacterium sp. UT-1RO-CII-1]